jgi:hypothetical protein
MCRFFTSPGPFIDLFRKALQTSVANSPHYKDAAMSAKVWHSAVGRLYAKAVEYQLMEGYCAPTTVRVVAKSIPFCDHSKLPPQVRGPSIPSKVIHDIDGIFEGKVKSSVIFGNEGYDVFLEAIKKSNNPKYRVSANFLRSSLFGMKFSLSPMVILLLTLFAGHFSPVVGYDEANDLVSTAVPNTTTVVCTYRACC